MLGIKTLNNDSQEELSQALVSGTVLCCAYITLCLLFKMLTEAFASKVINYLDAFDLICITSYV